MRVSDCSRIFISVLCLYVGLEFRFVFIYKIMSKKVNKNQSKNAPLDIVDE